MKQQSLFIYCLFVVLSISSWLGQSFQPITTTTSLSRKRNCLVGDAIVLHKHKPRRSYHTTRITTKGIVSSSSSSLSLSTNKKTTYWNNNSSFKSLLRSSSSSSSTTIEKKTKQQQKWCNNNIFLIKKSKLSFLVIINKIIKNICYKIKQCQQVMKRRFLIVVIFFLVLFSPSFPTTTTTSHNNNAWAAAAGPAGVTRSRSTGGRVSGSFGRSSSSSSPSAPKSRPSYSPSPPRSYSNYRPRPTYYYKPRRPRIIVPPPTRHIHVYDNNLPHPTTSTTTSIIRYQQQRGPTVGDLMLVTGTGLLITYGIKKHYDNQDRDGRGGDAVSKSALGYGVSVVSLTVALIVPDRLDEDSILTRIKNLASNTQSNSRRSVQKLVSSTTLELLRQDKAIVSVGTEYKHFQKLKDAERQFNIMSLEKRSKFDKETFNNADGTIETTNTSSSSTNKSSATTAVIDISLCIEGDTTKLSTIKNRSQLRDALYRISSDAQVEECLLAAEVLWTPDDDGDNMSESDVFADYPTLVPLFD